MWVVPAPGDTPSHIATNTPLLWRLRASAGVSTKTFYSESFPSVKRGTYYIPHYRLKGAHKPLNYRLKGAHTHIVQII